MAILEKEILIGLSAGNFKHYENLGYKIPRVKNKNGKFVLKKGATLLIKVDALQEGSRTEITRICDDCGKQTSNYRYVKLIYSRKLVDGKDRCYECSYKMKMEKRLKNIPYKKTLEFFAIENNKEYLLEEFSSNNIKKPSEISKGTSDVYLWICKKCKNEFKMSSNKRTNKQGQGCPYCSVPSKKVLKGFNDLWTTHPEIAKLLVDTNIGYNVTSGCNDKAEFVCNECGNIDMKTINNMTKRGFSCSKCSDGVSYSEKFMMNLLDQLNIVYITQKVFNWSKRRIYDFYIPSLNCIIETHGKQHYTYTGFNRSLEEEQENDKLKEKLASQNKINRYVVINCSESNENYIRKSIFNSDISMILDLKNINWSEAHDFACKTSLLKNVCNLWNEGIKESVKIEEILKISKYAAKKLLKQGAELGWCDFQNFSQGYRYKKETIQLSMDGQFVAEYVSQSEAGIISGISPKRISQVCTGKKKSAGGYKWVLKENYIKN